MKKPFEEGEYKEFQHKVIFIECPEAIDELAEHYDLIEGANGMLVYGFVAGAEGMCFALLASAKKTDDGLEVGKMLFDEVDYPRFRYNDVQYYTFDTADEHNLDTSQYAEAIEAVWDKLEPHDKLSRQIYDLEIIDGSRHPVAPDYVSVILQKEGLFSEMVWARIVGFAPDHIVGKVHGEPRQDFGIKEGDTIPIAIVDYGDRIALVWMPELSQKYS